VARGGEAVIALLALLIGAVSALAYARRRKWIDAALALLAGLALAVVVGGFTVPSTAVRQAVIDSDKIPTEIDRATSLKVIGDGLREPQWRDLPALPLTWTAPATDTLQLDFPRQLSLGRMFTLTITRAHTGEGRLQLLAENGQVIADAAAPANAREVSVRWLPPVAESLVLTARLLDGAGKLVASGPVPLVVGAAAPLQVQGRFGAPSFDANVLNTLLANSHALVDWQVTLGKTVMRAETARADIATPNLLVVDAAYLERLNAGARTALLARVADGMPMIVLGANASDTAFWSRELQLGLKPQAEDKAVGTPPMSLAPFNPSGGDNGVWSAASTKLWTRPWHKGRITWLGLADWHRYAISEPQALALWWQGVLDAAGVERAEDVVWQTPQEMPLPGQRLEVCALGARGEVVFPDLRQRAQWQRRADHADAACVAVWPREAGWMRMETQGAKPAAMKLYVFAPQDWPAWQSAQRRAATARHAARAPAHAKAIKTLDGLPVPAWPFALLFAFAMLGLWWRERR
jgi:hypothetical protein